ncbi:MULTISPECIES: DUF2188 domain-containing protein [Cobetia]|uniref:DUF2188 domain-containing protein n=1 Tax=Cobetia TaxID=204286 RepID=UPI0009EB66E6
MTAPSSIRVVIRGNQWGVKREGKTQCIRCFTTQYDAIDYARGLAARLGTKLVIEARGGNIVDKHSSLLQ